MGVYHLKFKIVRLIVAVALMIGFAAAVEIEGSWLEEPPAEQNQLPQESLDFTQFYSMVPGGPAEGTEQFSLTDQQPATLYVGGPDQEAMAYSQLQSYSAFTGGNSLWIKGTSSWTQYVQVPQGAHLSLVATTPGGGFGYLYEIYPSGKLDRSYSYFYPTTRIGFIADEIGQHVMLFTANNFASNAIIIDVKGYFPGPGPGPGPGPYPSFGQAKVNIVSSWLKGYDVFVDGIHQFTEGQGGVPDGYSSFTVTGNTDHKIEIRKGGYYYSQTRFFQAGATYTLRIN
jgi:hypothetical protein